METLDREMRLTALPLVRSSDLLANKRPSAASRGEKQKNRRMPMFNGLQLLLLYSGGVAVILGFVGIGYLVSDLAAKTTVNPAHHRQTTFQEEYVMFLKKHGVDYDEKFLWD
jgi:hypothetical protein